MVENGTLSAATAPAWRLLRRVEGAVAALDATGTGYTKRSFSTVDGVTAIVAVGYARASTSDQRESDLGLEAQRRAIREAAEARGWPVVAIFEDRASSGRTMNRAGLQAALKSVEETERGVLVVSKLDRISRSVVDFATLMGRARKKGWGFAALDLGVDTTTPVGQLVANVMAAVAQWEREVIGQRTKEALAVKRGQGVRLGRPRSLSDDAVRRIKTMKARGMTITAIAAKLNSEGVPTAHGGKAWYPATVKRVLSSQGANAGTVRKAMPSARATRGHA